MTGGSYYQPSGVYKNSGGVRYRGGTDGSNGSFSPAHSSPSESRVSTYASRPFPSGSSKYSALLMPRSTDETSTPRSVTRSWSAPSASRSAHLEGGVVQADPGALARRVRTYPLEGDVVVVLAERQERTLAVPFGHR